MFELISTITARRHRMQDDPNPDMPVMRDGYQNFVIQFRLPKLVSWDRILSSKGIAN